MLSCADYILKHRFIMTIILMVVVWSNEGLRRVEGLTPRFFRTAISSWHEIRLCGGHIVRYLNAMRL